ncbi:MAG: hypothetical protein PX634_23870 [Microcystis sp. M53600_WE12]|nr:hypothetical protein [Microcystis sp. M53600_WE12]
MRSKEPVVSESRDRRQETGDRRQETGDYFYLFFPLPYFPTSLLPHFPTSPLPHFPTSPLHNL